MTNKVEKEVVAKTPGQVMWEEIKNHPLDMFGLPGQTVSNYCSPMDVEPSRLFLSFKVQSVLPALETALGKKFNFEMANKIIIITRK